ncbi:MAG: nuclear transport factor 2 family protein [Actinomycetota bacterium]|nr:nuclear transport factor 2 family protein [Actinomycetota bacterium]
MSTEEEVRQASDRFYAALERMLNGDAGAMSDVWSHDPAVSTMHPLGGREVGWDAVRGSWEGAAQAFEGGSHSVSDLEVSVLGDLAYTTGIEHVDATLGGKSLHFDIRATNIYRREDGEWKIIHHHTDADRPLQEALGLA